MARDTWAYREVVVESVLDARTGKVRMAPAPGQAFACAMRVQCSRRMLDLAVYPLGTRFLLSAKATDRLGGEPYLYAWHGDPVRVMTPAAARKFLGMYRRLRV